MGKIVKYCSACDESFAHKLGSCPVCGAALQSFTLNPVETATADAEIVVFATDSFHGLAVNDGGFHVTVIEDKNVAARNGLLLATFGFMLCALLIGVVISIFSKDVDIGAINGNDLFNAVIADTTPMTVEEEQKKKEDAKKAGGGGGGGNEDPNPASQGVRPPMRRDPEMAPSTSMDRLTNPSIPVQMAIKGPIDESNIDRSQPYGLKYGASTLSDGPGSNGGIGTGRDGGVGGSTGPGYGPGKNGGLGGGTKGGIGPDDENGIATPPPSGPVGVTQAMRIISKPKPSYTDDARQNLVQGTVILRVTFLASGSIGSISAIKGLPNGLTEQAIAAARSMRFEPAKVNGQTQTVTKQVEYTFSIF